MIEIHKWDWYQVFSIKRQIFPSVFRKILNNCRISQPIGILGDMMMHYSLLCIWNNRMVGFWYSKNLYVNVSVKRDLPVICYFISQKIHHSIISRWNSSIGKKDLVLLKNKRLLEIFLCSLLFSAIPEDSSLDIILLYCYPSSTICCILRNESIPYTVLSRTSQQPFEKM